MKAYFLLQFKMTNRKLADYGLNPILGFCIIFAVFIGFSMYLFSRTEFAVYMYMLIAWSFVAKLSEKKRNDFLKSIFLKISYVKLRMIENSIVVLPFVAFLIYKQLFPDAIMITAITLMMALVNFNSTFNYTIPTPFYKKPFEFTVGFRNTFYLFLLNYSLACIAASVGNFNLGVFALLLVFLLSFSFYSKPENEYYVWSFIDTPKGFLIKKIKTAFLYSTLLSIPILLILCIFFPGEIKTILLFQLLSYIYLVTIIFAKYSNYPDEMNVPQGFLIALSVLFPPVLVGVIPFFYVQSMKKLNVFLA